MDVKSRQYETGDRESNDTGFFVQKSFLFSSENDVLNGETGNILQVMDNTTVYVLLGVFAVLILLWMFLETHYFIQIVIAIVRARFFKKKVGILEETTYYGICSTTDIDVFFDHMNNSRYLREVDFARSDFYNRTRLYGKILEKNGKVVVGANVVTYRRPIRPLSAYRITSKIVFWDKKSIFMEHHFITTRDTLVRAIVLSQQRFIKCDVDEILCELQGPEAPIEKPPQPVEVMWLLESITSYSKRVYHETGETCKPSERNKNTSLAAVQNIHANGHIPVEVFGVYKLSHTEENPSS